jgi:hypothetical protein
MLVIGLHRCMMHRSQATRCSIVTKFSRQTYSCGQF